MPMIYYAASYKIIQFLTTADNILTVGIIKIINWKKEYKL